jgi:hypothetical protein
MTNNNFEGGKRESEETSTTRYWRDDECGPVAEAVRFELTEGVNPRRFSRPVP